MTQIETSTSHIFKDSNFFFYDFLERNDILLDHNYDKILALYNTNISTEYNSDSYCEYSFYFNIFRNYDKMKEKIYIFYYIVILFLIDVAHLKNFVRYIISIYNRLELINNDIKNIHIQDMSKLELLFVLDTIINNENSVKAVNIKPCNILSENVKIHENIKISKFYVLLICFQSYF
jgi:hypothetical protein